MARRRPSGPARLGFVHSKRHPDGLTRAEAEVALGKLREQVAIERTDERAALETGGEEGADRSPRSAKR